MWHTRHVLESELHAHMMKACSNTACYEADYAEILFEQMNNAYPTSLINLASRIAICSVSLVVSSRR